jgi:hypothetical protein
MARKASSPLTASLRAIDPGRSFLSLRVML